MLANNLRRWPSIKPTWDQRPMFVPRLACRKGQAASSTIEPFYVSMTTTLFLTFY